MRHDIFEKNIRERVVQNALEQQQDFGPSYGIVLEYDAKTNTATVLLTKPNTDVPDEVLREVMCPTNLGIQGVNPEPGRPCWVVFSNGKTMPVITHFFNHRYDQYDYIRQTRAIINTPRYMFTM